ncbi:MAG: carboxyl transferase domain-containing protein [Marinobacter sp.]|uniref:acetyl-CoA carboxylase family protein n=1 Tax=Marinobacter sp. TaxID=50741 RepID=UPI00299E7451|nr:carboxyl transferase domain-containing protein [Marinobacter sp.]MDX1635274.1 carboxyl transferase domain-containing protein [Marinobacter sp.]
MNTRIEAVLIANRGEIAIRIARSLAEGGTRSVGVFAADEAGALHSQRVDHAVALSGSGPRAYLDGDELVRVAQANGCQAIHPGYGFLSENADFARQCREAGLLFIGPSPDCLALLGDKASARALAREQGVPLAEGTGEATNLEQARDFLTELQRRYGDNAGIMIKALAGGGGRGMRPVQQLDELDRAYTQCRAEARAAFGNDAVYVERLITEARHVEVQVIADGEGNVGHLWDRDCSLQRNRQKLVEVAPAPGLSAEQRHALIEAAMTLARAAGLQGLATFEFLLEPASGNWVFMEANPRLQVEHTVTEAISGVDLVAIQVALVAGESLDSLGLAGLPLEPPAQRAMQLRINLETVLPDGSLRPASGQVQVYEPPGGPGIRVDGCGHAGMTATTAYDSLLAKLVVSGRLTWPALLDKARRALTEFRLEGVASNLGFLARLLSMQSLRPYEVSIDTVAARLSELAEGPAQSTAADADLPEGARPVVSPVQGRLLRVAVSKGEQVAAGAVLAVVEAMKMEFELKAPTAGQVTQVFVQEGASLDEGAAVLALEADDQDAVAEASELEVDLGYIREDLARVQARHQRLQDDHRPEAVAKRRRTGQRTARENLADLMDEGSFIEYGALALAARRRRQSEAELMEASPADGLIAGIGTVNGDQFAAETARCMALAYDYTVYAGTQGVMNHKKTDRMLQLAAQWSLPVVLFAEGGGGRPGDTDFTGVAGLDCHTFTAMAALSGKVPLIGIVSGRCFAGNAALLGCCDVIIATRDATIGMAGPAMIEGGGLGRYSAEEVGPVSVQSANGVVDVVVADEAEAVAVARQYLAFVQGARAEWQAADQRWLRHLVPEHRRRAYDMREVIRTLADTDSVLELRPEFAPGMITAMVRIEGRACGLIANDPRHLGGAIDAAGGDKAARFMRLSDNYGLPIVSLCDTPGFMVGPEAEKQGTVRHVSRMFVAAARLRVPFFTVVVRKGYGLGAQAMAAGSFHSPLFTIGWPSSEFGAMGLEGAVRLGYAKELAAIADADQRQHTFERMVAKAYEQGQGTSMASFLEIDAVIDPAETRRWLVRGLDSAGRSAAIDQGQGGFIDTW